MLFRTSARRYPATLCAVVLLIDIIGSFKLPSLDMRLGANEAPGNAVSVRRSSCSNKGRKTLRYG